MTCARRWQARRPDGRPVSIPPYRLFSVRPCLYVILDAGLVGPQAMPREGRALLDAGIDALQIRAKRIRAGEMLAIVEDLLPACRRAGVPLIVNDRVDVAWMAQADGVHLGANDLRPSDARSLLGEHAIIGCTAHTAQELASIGDQADYVGYGAVFPTSTRAGSEVCGLSALTRAAAATTLPLIAIGGLNSTNVPQLRGSGVAGIAVASAVTPVHQHPDSIVGLRAAMAHW